MLNNLTSRQISEWQAINRIDPLNKEQRLEFMLARLCSVITNLAGSVYGKKGQFKQTKPLDFLPDWGSDGKPKRQSVDEMKSILMTVASASKRRRHKTRVNRPPKRLRKDDG